ncbi:MAG: hypothetical protein AB7D27_13135 [Desulfomicrobium sp.]
MNNAAMKRIGVFLGVLLASASICPAAELKQPTQAEIAMQVAEDDSLKAVMRSFFKAGLTYDSLPEGAGEEIRAALKYWKGNPEGLKAFKDRLGKLAASGSEKLLDMIRNKKLREFALASLDESVSGAFRNLGPDGLKKLVAYSGDVLDDAGVKALDILNRVEDAITTTGKVPAHLADDLKTALNQLSPEQLRAARKLLSEKGAKTAVKDYLVANPGVIGTFVDGVFVLANDVPALMALDDAEEAAASATGTGFGFAAQTAGTAATAALGGGFLPGLVVSWSSAQVKEAVTEMIMLQYDRANAAMKEQWADMELRMNAIRGMLKVDELLKTGDVSKAADYLAKVERYAMEHNFPNEGVFEKIQDLKGIVAKAEERRAANQVIAQARVPYMRGYRLASQGRNLVQARSHVEEALAVLREAQVRYPELADRVRQTQELIAHIERMIADAPPLGQATVSGPDSVAPGEVAHFEVGLTGGIPDYRPVDMGGYGLSTGAVFFWEAPAEPGVRTVTFRVRDDAGKIAEVTKDVEVAGDVQDTEMTGEIWEIMRKTPMMTITMPLKTFKVKITPGKKISFPVDYKDGDFQIKGSGLVTLSADGRMIELLSMDTESIDIKSGEVWGQEELRVGPFKLHTANTKDESAADSVFNSDRLYYVYASGFREDRGTLRMGEAEFGYDSGNNFVKKGFKWHDVQRLDTTSNYYSHYETIYFHFDEDKE